MCSECWETVPDDVKREVLKRRYGWKNYGAAEQYLADWARQRKQAIA